MRANTKTGVTLVIAVVLALSCVCAGVLRIAYQGFRSDIAARYDTPEPVETIAPALEPDGPADGTGEGRRGH